MDPFFAGQAVSATILPARGDVHDTGGPFMDQRFNHNFTRFALVPIACCILFAAGCSKEYKIVGVDSPGPGYLEVLIKPDPADTLLVIAGDTVRITEGGQDSLALFVSQGNAFRGQDFGSLFRNLSDYLQRTEIYNPIRKSGGTYQPIMIFHSYLPPATYDSLRFSLTADYLQIGFYQIPLAPVEGASDFVVFPQGFRIDEGRTTVITLHLKPLGSLTRVGDSYQYSWDFDLVEITNQ